MQLTSRDSAAFASLLPEEIALCYILVKLAFPATYICDTDGGLVGYVARRWFVEARRQ